MVRRSSFAVAAALTTVALTTTAAVSFTGDNSDAVASAAEKVAQPTTQPVAITSAVVTDPEVRSASEKADAVLQARGRYSQGLHVLGELNHTIACDINRARHELGYEPTVALEEGMRASIRWCLEHGEQL